jgi:hypothetical protein
MRPTLPHLFEGQTKRHPNNPHFFDFFIVGESVAALTGDLEGILVAPTCALTGDLEGTLVTAITGAWGLTGAMVGATVGRIFGLVVGAFVKPMGALL